MLQRFKPFLLVMFTLAVFIASCKKNKPSTVPKVTTTAATNIMATSATTGGTITSNGGEDILAAGVCYSKTSQLPTITDDTTKNTIVNGSFVSELTNIQSSSTYYVRAYATNSVGTGYGNVIQIVSGNAAPVATNVAITGTAEVNKTLTAGYIYADGENDPESGTTFQWYVATDATGAGETPITGATAQTFVVQDAQQGKFIRVGVTPMSSAGSTTGMEVKSSFTSGIGQATTVTFTYNGQSVTYGILNSATTGRKWLDRNLGAAASPTAFDDWANYGDLFQWGRGADGHQIITRTGPNDWDEVGNDWIGVETIGTYDNPAYSSTDNPGHAKFITVNDGDSHYPFDWRKPQNENLWQGVNGLNNPCPAGWRLPTKGEIESEGFSSGSDAFSKLKFTKSGSRNVSGDLGGTNNFGYYWTSTAVVISTKTGITGLFGSYALEMLPSIALFNGNGYGTRYIRSNAYAVRCIKN